MSPKSQDASSVKERLITAVIVVVSIAVPALYYWVVFNLPRLMAMTPQ